MCWSSKEPQSSWRGLYGKCAGWPVWRQGLQDCRIFYSSVRRGVVMMEHEATEAWFRLSPSENMEHLGQAAYSRPIGTECSLVLRTDSIIFVQCRWKWPSFSYHHSWGAWSGLGDRIGNIHDVSWHILSEYCRHVEVLSHVAITWARQVKPTYHILAPPKLVCPSGCRELSWQDVAREIP